MVLVEKKSQLTDKTNQMEIPASVEKVELWLDHKNDLPLIQNFFPELNAEQREFLLSGATPEEWESMLPPDEDDL